jgi:hypothetical protein
MIPLAIQGFMIPLGLALAPFGKGCRAVIEPDLIVPLYMIIYKRNYIIMNFKVNTFNLFVGMISQLLYYIQIVG